MSTLGEVAAWFTTGAHWRGVDGIPHRLGEHVVISAAAVAIAAALAVPVALTLGHLRRGGLLATGVSNAGRAVPSFALLAVLAQFFGVGSAVPVVAAMVALACPVILAGTHAGVTAVDRDVVDAARGMGLAGWQVLVRIELPLALPMLAGAIRTAAVQVVATATLAALLAQGGLGRFIVDGQSQGDVGQLVGGAILVALLAIATEFALSALERAISTVDRPHRIPVRPARPAQPADDGQGASPEPPIKPITVRTQN